METQQNSPDQAIEVTFIATVAQENALLNGRTCLVTANYTTFLTPDGWMELGDIVAQLAALAQRYPLEAVPAAPAAGQESTGPEWLSDRLARLGEKYEQT